MSPTFGYRVRGLISRNDVTLSNFMQMKMERTSENDFNQTWTTHWLKELRSAVRATIRSVLDNSIGGVSIDDVEQDVALASWISWESGERKTKSFWTIRARWVTISYLRKYRRQSSLDIDGSIEPMSEKPTHCAFMDACTLVGDRLASNMLLDGVTDMASKIGVSKATASRVWNAYCAVVQAREEGRDMNNTIKIKQGKTSENGVQHFRAYVGSTWVAEATFEDGTVRVIPREGSSVVAQEVEELILAMVEKKSNRSSSGRTRGGRPTASKTIKEETKKARKNLQETKGEVEVTPTAKPSQKKADAVDTDFPTTVEKWVDRCGGKGKCQCGCGEDVKGRFKQGHDSRLKSLIKTSTSPNRHAMLKAYGWEGLVKITE